MKLWELMMAWDSKVLADWDQTALVAAMLDGLAAVTISLHSKKRVRPRGYYHFHPYRKAGRTGMKITAKNIGDLKVLANITMGKRG